MLVPRGTTPHYTLGRPVMAVDRGEDWDDAQPGFVEIDLPPIARSRL